MVSCTKPIERDYALSHKILIDEIPDDIKVPIKMWDDIEADPIGIGESRPEVIEDDEKKLNRNTILFSPVTVILKEHNPNVLTNSEIRIELPRGGGKIDLSKYTGNSLGSFFVKFEWPEWKEAPEIRSFYVSRARKRKLDGEVYGVGCNKYLEMSSEVAKENSKLGLKVNTTRDRHVTALSGHFVFAIKNGRQIFLSQVTFYDSTNRSLICEELKVI